MCVEGFRERRPYNRQSLPWGFLFCKKQKFSGGFRGVSVLDPEVTESAEFYTVSDEIHRWASLSEGEFQLFVSAEDGVTVLNEFEMMCQLRILFPLHFVVFNQTVCHLSAETNVEQVFLRSEQLSELNLDPDTLADMVWIMVNMLQQARVQTLCQRYHGQVL